MSGTDKERIESRQQVLSRTGLSKTVLYEQVKLGKFPAPVTISSRRVGWLSSEVDAWFTERLAERDRQSPRVEQDHTQGGLA